MTSPDLRQAELTWADRTSVNARRIGVLGDDHTLHDANNLPEQVLMAFADVDLIAHLGHMSDDPAIRRSVLNRLETLAPVLAVQDFTVDNEGRPRLSESDDDRIQGLTRVIEAAGVRIGLVHSLERSPGPAIESPSGGIPDLSHIELDEVLIAKFGRTVDVVAFGGTHRAVAIACGSVLFVNPGSPTYPRGLGRNSGHKGLGTVGILHAFDGFTVFEVVNLSTLPSAKPVADS